MKETLADEILKEGIAVLYKQLGALKTLKFLQLLGTAKGDSVKEIEAQTEKMTPDEVLNLITNSKKKRSLTWKKISLL